MDGLKKIPTDQGKSFENNLIQELCELAQVKKLCTCPYHPETNGQCEHFNTTLINMLGTLPTRTKKNWQEWVTTLTHAYNCTVSLVIGFSPYFLMFGQTPKIPLDIEMGVTLIEQEQTSYQNYAKKQQARLKWGYQKAQENNKRESEHHKRYCDQRMRFMSLKPNDLVLVHAKAQLVIIRLLINGKTFNIGFSCQLDDQPVFRVQPVDAVADENIRVLHQNMLFPVQSVTDSDSVMTDSESEWDDGKHVVLMTANLLMDIHFNIETIY